MAQSDLSNLRLGTRGSMLARAQSGMVASWLEERHPGLKVELVLIKTSGDRITDRPLHEFGGKGLFTKELEQALLAEEIDFAVHSFKDVPVTMPLVDQTDLVIAAVPQREDPRDVIVSANASSLRDLRAGSRVGTGSLRRRAQILDQRPDLVVEPIRGNIDTRLRKLDEGDYDAVILAFAGLKRAGLFDSVRMSIIEPSELLPAPGQGALALQCRRDDATTRNALAALHHAVTAAGVEAERELVRLLQGDCHSPIAALTQMDESGITLAAAVGARDGSPPVVRASVRSSSSDVKKLSETAFQHLRQNGACQLLHGA